MSTPHRERDFADKIVLVTGAASGIGRATASCFAQRGARLALADLNTKRVTQFAEELQANGSDCQAYTVDVGDEPSVAALHEDIQQHFGGLDVACNNAGISDTPQPLTDMSLECWERMIRINQTSVFLCLKNQLRYFLNLPEAQRHGKAIVNVSSGAGLIPAPGQAHYTAAKHAVIGLTRYAASEQASNGIRINAVCPGFIDTPMLAASVPQPVLDKLPKALPQGRLGSPEELADVIVWLCSHEARWVNGQSIVVDGGQLFH